jgi:hypothetical protein
MENRSTDTLKMLEWETKKGQRNLDQAEEIRNREIIDLIENTVDETLGISFEELFQTYQEHHADIVLKKMDLVRDVLEIIELQLGEEIDESNIVLALVMFYGSLEIGNNQEFIQPPTDLIEKIEK